MANPYQQQSLRRKLTYLALVLVLISVTLILRELKSVGLKAQAGELKMREEDLGEVDLTGSALRLTLTGSRGLTICGLWLSAMEKQKKHEWNKLELIVRSLT